MKDKFSFLNQLTLIILEKSVECGFVGNLDDIENCSSIIAPALFYLRASCPSAFSTFNTSMCFKDKESLADNGHSPYQERFCRIYRPDFSHNRDPNSANQMGEHR